MDLKKLNLTDIVPAGNGIIIESELPVGSRFSFSAKCGRYFYMLDIEVTPDTFSYASFKLSAVSPYWPPPKGGFTDLIVSYDCDCKPKVRSSGLWVFLAFQNFDGGIALRVSGTNGYIEIDFYKGNKLVATLKKYTYSDNDKDDLSSYLEEIIGSSDKTPDTDGDGLSDYKEYLINTNPKNSDTDDDGIPDGEDKCPTMRNIGVIALKVSESYEIDRACVGGSCTSKIFDRDIYTFELDETPEEVPVKVRVMLCHARSIFNVCVKADYWEISGTVSRGESTSLCNLICLRQRLLHY